MSHGRVLDAADSRASLKQALEEFNSHLEQSEGQSLQVSEDPFEAKAQRLKRRLRLAVGRAGGRLCGGTEDVLHAEKDDEACGGLDGPVVAARAGRLEGVHHHAQGPGVAEL